MRISFGRLAFSILLCSCLLGCCQIKEGVCAVSDGHAAADADAGGAPAALHRDGSAFDPYLTAVFLIAASDAGG